MLIKKWDLQNYELMSYVVCEYMYEYKNFRQLIKKLRKFDFVFIISCVLLSYVWKCPYYLIFLGMRENVSTSKIYER